MLQSEEEKSREVEASLAARVEEKRLEQERRERAAEASLAARVEEERLEQERREAVVVILVPYSSSDEED